MKAILLVLFILTTGTMNAQNLKGKNWTARKVDSTYIVSIADKSSLLESLTDFVVTQKITAGQITGIGATNQATLRFFDPQTKKYVDKTFREQMEISNLSGNISEVEGKAMLHLHITLGRSDYTALAGHLLDAKIRGAGEFFVYPLNSNVVKVKNEEVGLNFYDFEK
ncbi:MULTISPECIES: PPC domain-containing DNA-binding protein [Bacteroidota]|uniref:PPC domain-containing DNA-binding protein n=1 Tax=Bacteroidota TaxID=976 RepID=UPI0024A613FB|nr:MULTISPECIES: PPC domain-containing DNA-binding protein [Bacteroidota]